jgi:hypothetical protein
VVAPCVTQPRVTNLLTPAHTRFCVPLRLLCAQYFSGDALSCGGPMCDPTSRYEPADLAAAATAVHFSPLFHTYTQYFSGDALSCGGPMCDKLVISLEGSVYTAATAYSHYPKVSLNLCTYA